MLQIIYFFKNVFKVCVKKSLFGVSISQTRIKVRCKKAARTLPYCCETKLTSCVLSCFCREISSGGQAPKARRDSDRLQRGRNRKGIQHECRGVHNLEEGALASRPVAPSFSAPSFLHMPINLNLLQLYFFCTSPTTQLYRKPHPRHTTFFFVTRFTK